MTSFALFLVSPFASLSLVLPSLARTTVSRCPVLATNQASLHFLPLFRLNFFRNLPFPQPNGQGLASAQQVDFITLFYFPQATYLFARLDILPVLPARQAELICRIDLPRLVFGKHSLDSTG